jgi:hypothetical protein
MCVCPLSIQQHPQLALQLLVDFLNGKGTGSGEAKLAPQLPLLGFLLLHHTLRLSQLLFQTCVFHRGSGDTVEGSLAVLVRPGSG